MPELPRVLHISPFHPELVADDAARAAHALFRAGRAAGQDTHFLGCCPPGTDPALFKPGAVITGFDQRADESLFLADSLEQAWCRNLNLRALTCFADFLRELAPRVVHFHGFQTVGLDLLLVARRTLPEARLVLTLHDLRGLCRAEGQMVRTTDGTLCDHASAVRCHQCFRGTPPEMFLLREDWVKHGLSVMDAFIAPNDFIRRRYLAWGLPAARMQVIDQVMHLDSDDRDRAPLPAAARDGTAHRFGFFGDLADRSGLGVLLDALAMLRVAGGLRLSLDVNAGGGEAPALTAALRDTAAAAPVTLRQAGAWTLADLPLRMARIDWVVVPSVGWDAAAPAVSLARAFGKPVVGSHIGGIAARVRHEQDGLLCAAGDAEGLAGLLRRCVTEAGLHARLAARIPGGTGVDLALAAHAAVYGLAGGTAHA